MITLRIRSVVALLASAIVTVSPRIARAQLTVITFDNVAPICQNFTCSPPADYPWIGAAFSSSWIASLGGHGNVLLVPYASFGGVAQFGSSAPFTLQSVVIGAWGFGTSVDASVVGYSASTGTVWQWFGLSTASTTGELFVNPYATIPVDGLYLRGTAFYDDITVQQVSTVPEPSTLALLAAAVALAVIARMRQLLRRYRDE